MTISRRKESATTLETLTGQARFGKLKTLSPSSWQVIYVVPHHDDGPLVFLSGINQARFGKLKTLSPSSWQVIYVMPHHDDGPQVFLSGIVCWFGSWVGSDKGAT